MNIIAYVYICMAKMNAIVTHKFICREILIILCLKFHKIRKFHACTFLVCRKAGSCILELCNTIDTTWHRDTKWVSNYSKFWYCWYWLCSIAKWLMFLSHIFNWLRSNFFHRISISIHRHMLNDAVDQILQVH